MRFKKNIAAKFATVIASATALGALWALAHTNPPASAGIPPTAAAATSAPATGGATTASRAAVPTPLATPKKNTRTRAS